MGISGLEKSCSQTSARKCPEGGLPGSLLVIKDSMMSMSLSPRPREANSKEASAVPAELGEPGTGKKSPRQPTDCSRSPRSHPLLAPTPPFPLTAASSHRQCWTGAQRATTRGTRVCLSLDKQHWLFEPGALAPAAPVPLDSQSQAPGLPVGLPCL